MINPSEVAGPQVGHWDGSVAVLQIPGPETPTLSSSGPNELSLDRLCHIVADQAPLRTVAWLPQLAANHVRDTTARHIFATAGHSATIKIWDSRCVMCQICAVWLNKMCRTEESSQYHHQRPIYCEAFSVRQKEDTAPAFPAKQEDTHTNAHFQTVPCPQSCPSMTCEGLTLCAGTLFNVLLSCHSCLCGSPTSSG